MRKSGSCPKCQSRAILCISQIADSYGRGGFEGLNEGLESGPMQRKANPWRLARIPYPGRRSWGTVEIATAGLVEAYVCKDCGFTEFYTKDPGEIPVDGVYVREINAR